MTSLRDVLNWLAENWKVWLDGLGVAVILAFGGWLRRRLRRSPDVPAGPPSVMQNAQQSVTVNLNVPGVQSSASHPSVRAPTGGRTRSRRTSQSIEATRRLRLVAATGIAGILVAGALFGYKRIGAGNLRITVYQPLLADIERIKADVHGVNLDDRPTIKTFENLKAAGAGQRLPVSIRIKLERISVQLPAVFSTARALRQAIIPEISARIKTVRTEESDRAWRAHATAVLREESRPKKGVPDTVIMLAAISHEYRGRVRDSQMLVAGPGGPVFVLRDWLIYPESLNAIEGLWTDLDYLYFNDRLERWYYQLTRADLEQRRVSLVQFLAPVHEALREDQAFQTLQEARAGLLAELADAETLVTDRIRDPKRIGDLISGGD